MPVVQFRHLAQSFSTAGSLRDEDEVVLFDQLTTWHLTEPDTHQVALSVFIKTNGPRSSGVLRGARARKSLITSPR